MIFRTATSKDEEQIAFVLKECYKIDSIEECKELFKNETIKQHHFILAIDKNKVIGLTTWLIHGLPKHGLCELDRIAVMPEYRGKGVAKQLFDELVKEADAEYKKHGSKLRKLYILTHVDNKRAQAFYKKMGLKHETTLKHHYYKGKDEFVYSKFF